VTVAPTADAAIAKKFGDGKRPEQDLGMRRRAWLSAWQGNALFFVIPLMLAGVCAYRNSPRATIRAPRIRRQYAFDIPGDVPSDDEDPESVEALVDQQEEAME
jgi:hypothetical protein